MPTIMPTMIMTTLDQIVFFITMTYSMKGLIFQYFSSPPDKMLRREENSIFRLSSYSLHQKHSVFSSEPKVLCCTYHMFRRCMFCFSRELTYRVEIPNFVGKLVM